MIRLAQLGDQIHSVLGSTSREKFDADNVGLRMDLQSLHSQLKELEAGGQLTANRNGKQILSDFFQVHRLNTRIVMRDLSYNFINMEVHSIGLRRNLSSSRAGGTSTQSPTDTLHLDHLHSCLQSAKAYLDAIIAMSVLHYCHLSFAEWMRLPRVLAIICKLCIPSNYHTEIHWDYHMAQERVRVDLYLESLCYRMQSLTMCDRTSQRLGDFWSLLKTLLERVRSWYTHRIQLSPEEVPTAKDTDALPRVSANGYEAQDSARAPIPEFAEMDRMMNDFERPFWVFDLFDSVMAPVK